MAKGADAVAPWVGSLELHSESSARQGIAGSASRAAEGHEDEHETNNSRDTQEHASALRAPRSASSLAAII
jgi:hypothetical protein